MRTSEEIIEFAERLHRADAGTTERIGVTREELLDLISWVKKNGNCGDQTKVDIDSLRIRGHKLVLI